MGIFFVVFLKCIFYFLFYLYLLLYPHFLNESDISVLYLILPFYALVAADWGCIFFFPHPENETVNKDFKQ